MTIQTNLKKWIGSEEYLILSQFIDLMDKIAGHVSTQQATEMFNQMDPSNNGQIPTSLLLHDEWLPRMILNLFQKDDDTASVATSNRSLPDDFGLEDDMSTDIEDLQQDEYISKVKTQKAEINRLKQWIIDHGQPAIEKVDELQMMLDVYEEERTDKQFELQTFQSRLSKMGEIEQRLVAQQSTSNLLLKENDSLLLSVHESAKKQEIERKKYNDALREAQEYKKLSRELQEINDKYNQKNQVLTEKQSGLEEENQNLRQLLLAYETEKTEQFHEYNEEIQRINIEMKSLQNDLESNRVHNGQGVRFYITDDDGNQSDSHPNQMRKRRMTLKNQNSSDDNINSMADEMDNSLTGRGRTRRDTIRGWYDAHMRKASHISLPNEDTLRNMPEDHEDDNGQHTIVVSFDRQDSAQSVASSVTASGQPPFLNARSYEDPVLYKQMDVSQKQDSLPLGMGQSAQNIHGKTHDDIFEDALAQELKVELRKKLAAEFKEDYELKLKQKEIEYQMKLHKETRVVHEEQRKEKEMYEKRIDELNNKLTEYSKNGKIDLVDNMSFEADEMVYLSGGDGGMTNFSSPISEYEVNSDDEKEAFDQGIMENDYDEMNGNGGDYILANGARHSRNNSGLNDHDPNDNEEDKPLIDKKRFDDNQYADQVLNNRDKKSKKKKKKRDKDKDKRKKGRGEGPEEPVTQIDRGDDKCFSCFGLFTGTGV
eukprot:CAMPEP_0201571142 /NCGR_PEP_ID=MMETSP0190_2-20130828/13763_1 /ASSEMBLY_ACC=CAM_ASM_000263 /TAXON_ID=37353 /ORGANISM="Rosalina sp." /LENGTH=709 /DNA_ID=CAMNT_0047995465 /DNA_START=518 /DNA_END=2647 /DNA_ORIENTATION=-